MMQILCNQYGSDIDDIDKEIQGWQEDHRNWVSFEGFQDRDKKIERISN